MKKEIQGMYSAIDEARRVGNDRMPISASLVIDMSERIKFLEQLVEVAYKEGANDALHFESSCGSDTANFIRGLWSDSDTKLHLEA